MHSGQQTVQAGQPRCKGRRHRSQDSDAIGRCPRRRKAHRSRSRALRRRVGKNNAWLLARGSKPPAFASSVAAPTSRATSPYSFQGLGEEGLKILAKVRAKFGFGIITEAIDNESLDLVEEYADVIQIGARNMQNFSLLKRAGRAKKPVLLKRGMSATLDEFLMAAEYILSEGNYNVMLCERGRADFLRFFPAILSTLAVVPAVKKRSHLPILVDPSHGTGKRHKVLPLSRAAGRRRRRRIACGSAPRPGESAFGRHAVDLARGGSRNLRRK